MTFAKPFTQRELEYVRANWKTKTVKEMASELHRSPSSVYKKINDMHLREAPPGGPDAAADSKGPRKLIPSEAGSLEDLRSLLWRSLQEAEPRDVPRLSKEYRDTVAAIEGRGSGDGADDDEADPIVERLRLIGTA